LQRGADHRKILILEFSKCVRCDHCGTFLPCLAVMERASFSKRKKLMKTIKLFQFAVKAAVAFTITAGVALAQEAADTQELKGEDKVVAIVNGYEIKASEVRMAFDDVVGQLPNIPRKLRYPFVVEFLVERHLLAQLANKEGISDTEDYKRRLAAYQAKALRDSFLAQKIGPEVSEAEMKLAYDEEAKKLTDTERLRARHILVASEKEAKDILAKLKKGEKFEALAKQYSLDGSKDYGGDLGYFTQPEMVPEFSKAAFSLEKGKTSEPVKTDFGWHIIRVEDRKMGQAQPYDQVKGAIRNVLVRKKVQDKLAELRKVATVEVIDEDLKKFAAEAAKQRKALEEKQQGSTVSQQPEATEPPVEGEGATGKGDLLLPEAQ
jgi:peptidyl-prolyl cis-trans isomerase C